MGQAVRKRSWWRTEFPQYVFIVGALLAFRSSFADHYVVPTGSMEPTLVGGDRVFVDKTAYGVQLPFTDIRVTSGDPVRRGDVVIFDSPRDGKRLIKRIVAVSGDIVTVRDGRVRINGRSLAGQGDSEIYDGRVVQLKLSSGGGPDVHRARIPAGQLLAVGDHRGNSLDGRVFGLIDEQTVYARAVAVYYRRGELLVWRPL